MFAGCSETSLHSQFLKRHHPAHWPVPKSRRWAAALASASMAGTLQVRLPAQAAPPGARSWNLTLKNAVPVAVALAAEQPPERS